MTDNKVLDYIILKYEFIKIRIEIKSSQMEGEILSELRFNKSGGLRFGIFSSPKNN